MADWIEGQIKQKIMWNDTHFSLHIKCDRSEFIAGQFIRVGLDVDGERLARPYSCVNPPDKPGVEIFFNTVPEGPLSNRLAKLNEGESIWLGDAIHGFLTLPQVPSDAENLWLIATGTGVGPFLSILQTPEAWDRFKKITLVYGLRHLSNFCYSDLIEILKSKQPEKLRVIPCVTGEIPPDGYNGRVTEAIQNGKLEELSNCKINVDTSHFMLCGNQAMIKDVSEILGERGLKKHMRRDPGQISSEKYH